MLGTRYGWQLVLTGLLCILSLTVGCPSPATTADQAARESADDSSSGGAVCPSETEEFADMVPATYAVVVQLKSPEDSTKTIDQFVGTAFAVDPWLLATNAHVANYIVEYPWPYPVAKVVAVQAGTGHVVEVDAAVSHPDYTGDPLGSPDVAVLQAVEQLDDRLELASDTELGDLALGLELALTGFPGDVQQWFEIVVGETVPQPTALTGGISSLRNFDPDVQVLPDNVDTVQHQVPTTPGTSGSPLVHCGKVVAVNNAGTVKTVVAVGPDGRLTTDRQAQAANNFGIHVKYLRELVSDVYDGDPNARALPPPPPDFSGTYVGVALTNDPTVIPDHGLAMTVAASGNISGTTTWAGDLSCDLTGEVDEFGRVVMAGQTADVGGTVSTYVGYISVATGEAAGFQYLDDSPDPVGMWAAVRE